MNPLLDTLLLAAAAAEASPGTEDLVAQFGVDGPRLLAQIIVFAVVFLVLKAYAFKPILAQLEKRKADIAEQLANSERVRKELAEAEEIRRRIVSEATDKAGAILAEAQKTAAAAGDRKLQDALAQAEALIAKAHDAVQIDRDRMMSELKAEIARLVIQTTAKVAGKVLTADDQKRLADETTRALAA